ncbi:MAG TPA: hemerythrin domain-containing protein [Pelomicrobium sp.]|nr:hemerythrin domain-containing protein [Pelomicrobium sp.]
MTAEPRTVDLRAEPPSQVQTAAFYAVRELKRGEPIRLLTADEPSLMMRSLDLLLRNNLAWDIEKTSDGFAATVRHRADTPPSGLADLLTRHHKALDAVFARAMHLTNAGKAAEAAPLVPRFGDALKRHIAVEDHLLAPKLGVPRDPAGGDPLSIMLREHREILAQFALIEAVFAGEVPDAGEAAAYFAILSGTLAKHEYREENNLFPLWSAKLAQMPPEDAAALEREAAAALGPLDP